MYSSFLQSMKHFWPQVFGSRYIIWHKIFVKTERSAIMSYSLYESNMLLAHVFSLTPMRLWEEKSNNACVK